MTNKPLNSTQQAALRRLLDQHTDQPACLLELIEPDWSAEIGSAHHYVIVEPSPEDGTRRGYPLQFRTLPTAEGGPALLSCAEIAQLRDHLTAFLDSQPL